MSTDFDVRPDKTGLMAAIPPEYRTTIFRVTLAISSVVIFLVGIFPLYWMAQSAFKTRQAILEGVSFFPTPATFTLGRFSILTSGDVSTYIFNSVVVTIGTIIMVVLISLLAGYGLARFDFKGKVNFARFLLFGYMFSPIVLALPLYLIWDTVGLLNTRIGLILALTSLSMPFGVWLMWKYMQTIPDAMEERAWLEGASRFRGFIDVIVPQTKPAIIANALFAFAIAWNDFTFAKILLPANEKTTFPPGVMRIVRSSYETSYGELMAVALLMTVPPLLFAFFLQSYLLKGFQIRSL